MITKAEEISNPDFGIYPGSRPVKDLIKCGIVLLDKPPGPTSHQVAAWVREILGIKKIGHSGTLDPKVTGVLVITLDKATKVMPALMGLDKEYVAVMHLHQDTDMEKLDITVKKFTGKIEQLPPKRSAVRRRKRIREVYEINILEKQKLDVLLNIKCQKGTYVRKLIHDLGRELGRGAHMRELRRVRVGPFNEKGCFKLQELKDSYVLWKEKNEETIRELVKPVEFGVEHLKKIVVRDSAVNALCNGAPLSVGGICRLDEGIEKESMTAILTLKGELIALGYSKMDSKEMGRSKSGIAAEVDRVVMKRDLYPRMWKN
ncbi:MAG: RNA-guided pseudouridylation complex pseudouridine synthase subunit Cbf5 [archaeon]|nr:MAG: RNA-guided pseudouridylation complex pseudouridine synthase subunit Cbf5 [archaeon]